MVIPGWRGPGWGGIGPFWLGQGKRKLLCSGGIINYPAIKDTSRKG